MGFGDAIKNPLLGFRFGVWVFLLAFLFQEGVRKGKPLP